MIAALLNSPRLLILDEPSTGIDVASRRHCHEQILKCVQDGASVFFASHAMDEVSSLSTDLCILVKGSVKEKGTIEEVEMRYGSGFLIRATTVEADQVMQYVESRLVSGAVSVEFKTRTSLALTVQRNAATLTDLFALMSQAKKQKFPEMAYTVSDSSLSSTFVRFVEEQRMQAESEGLFYFILFFCSSLMYFLL